MLTVHVESSPTAQHANIGRAGYPGPPTVTLLCHGRIVLGVETETLRCIATSRQERRVVVDLYHVHGIDAAGLGLLVELHCWARQRAGWLSITRPSPCVRRLVALTGLNSVLDIELTPVQADLIPCERSAMTA
jgi:HptB-dependent secretion and biofilm anti anti-sigma factor